MDNIRVETIERQFSIHVYLSDSPNYNAVCIVNVYGDRGHMFAINGVGFYKAAPKIFEACESHGISILEGYVLKSHAMLMKRACRDFADVVIVDKGTLHDKSMSWITVKRKKIEKN